MNHPTKKSSSHAIVSVVLPTEAADWWRQQARRNDRSLSSELRRVLQALWVAQALPVDEDRRRAVGER